MVIDISQVKDFVGGHLKTVRKAAQVADVMQCSLDRLKKSFYRMEKQTLSRYIRQSKVDRMKERLLCSTDACKVICIDLGIREDVGARLFKNVTGMTMEEFRRLNKGAVAANNLAVPPAQTPKDSEKRLVLTEQVVRQMLSTRAGTGTRRRNDRTSGVWIQGAEN